MLSCGASKMRARFRIELMIITVIMGALVVIVALSQQRRVWV